MEASSEVQMVDVRRRLPAAALAMVLCAAAPLAAQDWKGMGRFEGRVLDPDGQPIIGAEVKLNLPSRGGGTTVKTDKKGRWAIAGVAAGQWDVDITAPGYVPSKGRFNLPSEESRPAPVVVKLEKAGSGASAPSADPALLAAVQKGDEAYKAGKFAEARAEYEKVLFLRPDLGPTLHELIARCYSQEGNYAKAVEHLQPVLEARPDDANVRVLMAQEALRGGLLDKGLELLKGLDEKSVTNAEIYFNVAAILRNQPDAATDPAKAGMITDYLSKAIALDAKYVDAYMQRAFAYLGAGKTAEARADFQKVVELAPGTPDAETAKKALASLK
jgi:tetratricopeptide (TPR) repeat protein